MLLVADRPCSNSAQCERLDCRAVVAGYVKPLSNHDFLWVFLTRFLMQQVRACVRVATRPQAWLWSPKPHGIFA